MFDKKRGMYLFLAMIVLLLIAVTILLLVKTPESKKISAETVQEKANSSIKEIKSCISSADCDDENSCTIEESKDGICYNVKVILYDDNDGCCPEDCYQRNDNDC